MKVCTVEHFENSKDEPVIISYYMPLISVLLLIFSWLIPWLTLASIFEYSKFSNIFWCIGFIGLVPVYVFSMIRCSSRKTVLFKDAIVTWAKKINSLFPIPLNEIDKVTESSFLGIRIIEINLKKDTPAGRTFRFIPAKNIFPKSNGCDLLEELYRLANAKKDS